MAGEGMQSLAGRRVLVSGGTTGIGHATVKHLVEVGARVMTFSHDARTLNAARTALPGVTVELADVGNPDDVRRIVAQAREAFGGLDALVNNAGITGYSVTDMPQEEWERVLRTNLLGAMHLAQEATPLLREAGGGHVVNVGSMSAQTRDQGMDVYVATKSGIRGWSDSFGRAVARDRIAVTLVEPGLVLTELTRTEGVDEKLIRDEKITGDDIARVIVFVLSQPLSVCIPQVQVRPRMQLI
jgi:NAD(P)-dependent dehydrogenase (short-subunit alcohol dehydrogenase family)